MELKAVDPFNLSCKIVFNAIFYKSKIKVNPDIKLPLIPN